jgi:hypothetical protein
MAIISENPKNLYIPAIIQPVIKIIIKVSTTISEYAAILLLKKN